MRFLVKQPGTTSENQASSSAGYLSYLVLPEATSGHQQRCSTSLELQPAIHPATQAACNNLGYLELSLDAGHPATQATRGCFGLCDTTFES